MTLRVAPPLLAAPFAEAEDTRPWSMPRWSFADGQVTAQIGGRLHLDVTGFADDERNPHNANGIQVRRGWVNLIGKVYGFDYRVSVDYADHVRSYKSVYVRRRIGPGQLTVGQFKPFFSLDDSISSDNIVLMERAFVATQFAPLFRLGAGYQARLGNMTLGVTRYSLNDLDKVRGNGSGSTLRTTWAPLHATGKVLHLGLSLAREWHARSTADGSLAPGLVVTPAGAKSQRSKMRLFQIRDGEPVDVSKYALEAATVTGSLSFQGEYGRARFHDGVQHALARTWYLQASYLLTGESRPYNMASGVFGDIEPRHPGGAWELAARYDHIDGQQAPWNQPVTSDRGVDAYVFGVNWYGRAGFRLMFNYIDSHNRDRLANTTLDHTRAVAARLQWIF